MAHGRTKNAWDLFSVRKYDLSGPQARYRFHPHRRILGPQWHLPPAPKEGKTGALSHLAGEERNQSGAEPEGTHGSCRKHLLLVPSGMKGEKPENDGLFPAGSLQWRCKEQWQLIYPPCRVASGAFLCAAAHFATLTCALFAAGCLFR